MTIERISSSNLVTTEVKIPEAPKRPLGSALAVIGAGAIIDFDASSRHLVGATALEGVDDSELTRPESPLDTASVASREEAPKTVFITTPRTQAASAIIENLRTGDTSNLTKNKTIIQRYLQELGKSTAYDAFGEIEERGTGKLKKISENKTTNIFANYQIVANATRELNVLVDLLNEVQEHDDLKDLFGEIVTSLFDAQKIQAEIFSQMNEEVHSFRDGVRESGELHPVAISVTCSSCFPFFRESFDAKLRKMKNAFEQAARKEGLNPDQAAMIKDTYLERALILRNPAREKIAVVSIAFGREDPTAILIVSGRKGMLMQDAGAKITSFNW